MISSALLTTLLLFAAPAAFAAPLLWEIGKADNDDREFALAPNRYADYREGVLYVVGKSDPKRDWPYVHPGPVDGWGGVRPQTFTIMFGLKAAPTGGDCALRFDLVDTHGAAPPELRIAVNGQSFSRKLPRGGGDASIFGDPKKGKEHQFALNFPASSL